MLDIRGPWAGLEFYLLAAYIITSRGSYTLEAGRADLSEDAELREELLLLLPLPDLESEPEDDEDEL